MKLSFLGKNRGKKFLTQIWVFGSFCTHPVKWPILDNFWPKWAKRDFFSKKRLEHFSLLKALINCKDSEKSNEGIPRKM